MLSPLDGVCLVLPVDAPVHVLRLPRVDGGVLGGRVRGARLVIISVRTLLRIPDTCWVVERASNEDFTITKKDPTMAFSWLSAPTLVLSHLRHYAKTGINPR